MAANGKHIKQKTKSVTALRNSKGDVECCLTALRFRITNMVRKLTKVPKTDKMIAPANAMVEDVLSIIRFEDVSLTLNNILLFCVLLIQGSSGNGTSFCKKSY